MEYRKIDERVFGVHSRGAWFILNTFPFMAFQVEDVDDFESLAKVYQEEIKGNSLIPWSDDYDFRGFFAMEWIMTSDCNLNCPHCFAHTSGETGRYGLGKAALTIEDLKDGIDKACHIFEEDISRNSLVQAEFQLFIIGGEPLMEFDNMVEAIEYLEVRLQAIERLHGMEKLVRNYFLATNGLLIDERIADYLSRRPFTVSVSIDTPINPLKLDEKKSRKTEVAVNGARKLLSFGMKKVIINCVIPAEKVYQLDQIMQYIESFGIMDQISGVQISPLTPPTRQAKYSGCTEERVLVSDWSKDVDRCRFFAGKLIEYCDRYNTDMKKYHLRVKSMLSAGGMGYRCPVGQWKWCLVPGGLIYPCHQFVGIDTYRMGNVHAPMEEFLRDNSEMVRLFHDRNVFLVKPCDECPLQSCCCVFIDCPGRALLEGGDLYHIPEHQCLMAKDYLLHILEQFLWGEA